MSSSALDVASATAPAPDWTGREIAQQPDIWRAALERVDGARSEIDAWLQPLLAKDNLRIILTGAGSSAYIGKALAPTLTRALDRPVEAISTTSIVGAPDEYLLADRPTLLVSYGRSGSSPESIGAVQLANQLVPDCYHLVLCCNPESALGRADRESARAKCLIMPPQALDQSFAMTSSFTSMLISTLGIFVPDAVQAERAMAAARSLIATESVELSRLSKSGFRRVAFLGTGALQGIATEAALKALELSAGRIDSYAESPLGFRHGPKFIVDSDTLVFLLTHPEPYSRSYDLDLAAELERDGIAKAVVRLDLLPELQGVALDAQWLGLVYLVWCQQFAYRHALALGITPDNPCPSGEVNRVVQGVTLHRFPTAA